jgi:hypothetical protein
VVDFSADRFSSKQALNVVAGSILRAQVVRAPAGSRATWLHSESLVQERGFGALSRG